MTTDIASRIAELPWFHRIPVAPGVVTPGIDIDAQSKAAFNRIPEDFTGKTVLDIGAWDGLFSFVAEERGASRVLATDSFAWDVVLFCGVLYHLRHPLLALEKVASVTSGMVILSTSIDMVSHERPAAAFYPGEDLNGDPTNWWGPNPACVEAMLRDVGFQRVEMVSTILSGTAQGVARVLPHAAAWHAWK
jgi:tRNA (mo5U34)-methyltransferase